MSLMPERDTHDDRSSDLAGDPLCSVRPRG
jgi:hypothetical protein